MQVGITHAGAALSSLMEGGETKEEYDELKKDVGEAQKAFPSL